jgi:hypothetical protein
MKGTEDTTVSGMGIEGSEGTTGSRYRSEKRFKDGRQSSREISNIICARVILTAYLPFF